MLSAVAEHRAKLGAATVSSACLCFSSALLGDLLLFSFNESHRVQAVLSAYPKLLVDLLVFALFGCLLTGLASFLAEGRRRTFSIAISFATFLLCTPLGAGY